MYSVLCRLELKKGRRRFSWEGTPHSIQTSIQSIVGSGACLRFSSQSASLFTDNGNLAINVTVCLRSCWSGCWWLFLRRQVIIPSKICWLLSCNFPVWATKYLNLCFFLCFFHMYSIVVMKSVFKLCGNDCWWCFLVCEWIFFVPEDHYYFPTALQMYESSGPLAKFNLHSFHPLILV